MIGLARLGLLVVLVWLGIGQAKAGGRAALVIGNAQYRGVAQIANPVYDAADIAAT